MTSVLTPPRDTLPARLSPLRGAQFMLERNLYIYRHTWYLLLAEIVEPALYLLSVGVGIGVLVGTVPGLGDVSYAEFVAPALLATAAMNGAVNETTFNLYGKLRLTGTYDSITASPMAARHVVLGEVLWAVIRGTLITAGFLVVVAGLDLSQWPAVLLVLPGAALIAFAFASAGLVVVTYVRSFQDFQLIQLVMLPMFLFATTFYPLSVYPQWIQPFIKVLPLYQSIELLRAPSLGTVGPQLLVPVAYLALGGALASRWAIARFGGLLQR